jgi:DDE superfamily endonuclease
VTTTQPAEDTKLVYQCALPLSRQTLTYVADLLRGHLTKIGSRWRKLPPGRIALIVVATLRHDHRLADMAGGNGVSASTICRWTWEVIGLLAARAPRLDRALAAIRKQGGEVVLLDGTLIPTRRRSGTANRANYNGKRKKHGLLFLALTDEAGNLAWISCARHGAASEITAARHDHITARLRAAGLGALADLGFTGLDPDLDDPVIITGYKATRARKTTPRPAAGQPGPVSRPRPRRARLQRPQELADPHPPAHRPRQGNRLAPRPARPHPPAHHPLTDDHDLRPAAPTSKSTANPTHTSPADQAFQVGTT